MLQELSDTMNRAEVPGRVEVIVNGYWQAWQKLRRMARLRKTSLNSFSALNDLVSFRLVVAQEDASLCYRLLGYVNRYLGQYLDQDRFDDYIALPQNGYRALQVTGWLPNYGAVEVAIATNDMEGENLWGVVYAIKNNQDISHYRPVEILTPTGGARFVPEGSTVLDAVASIQQEFLPQQLPQLRNWEIAACFYPARRVSGDFYDAFLLPDGLLGLVIADVCDKGVGSALFMALIRSLIRVFAGKILSLYPFQGSANDQTDPEADAVHRGELVRPAPVEDLGDVHQLDDDGAFPRLGRRLVYPPRSHGRIGRKSRQRRAEPFLQDG